MAPPVDRGPDARWRGATKARTAHPDAPVFFNNG